MSPDLQIGLFTLYGQKHVHYRLSFVVFDVRVCLKAEQYPNHIFVIIHHCES